MMTQRHETTAAQASRLCGKHRTAVLSRYAASGDAVEASLRIETGTLADYKHLASYHYRSANPGAATTVLRMVHDAPTVQHRFLAQSEHHETTIVGVLVRSLPALSCALRDVATRGRYRNLSRRESATLLNREMRTISRVVIDPRWRGLGLAVRLVRHALDHPETLYTEALAVMGHVHPFFERAGMQRYERPLHQHDARLVSVLAHIDLDTASLASIAQTMAHLQKLDDGRYRWFEHELRRWARQGMRQSAAARDAHAVSIEHMLAKARTRLILPPVYYLTLHGENASHDDQADRAGSAHCAS